MELRLRKLEVDFLEQKNKEAISSKVQESRMSKIEKNLQAQEDKLSTLEDKQEFQFSQIANDLNSLKEGVFDNKNRKERPAENKALRHEENNDINGPPTSCEDLKQFGHTLNSYYLVKNNNKIQTIYCDFNKLTGSFS